MPPAKDPTVIMNAVVLDEPEGYQGQRRRFWLTRKAGGAALPALLVAASVVVVLIVIGVAQLLPRQASGQIPLGAGGSTASDDNGQAQPDPADSNGARASASARASKSPSAKPSASASASQSATAPAGGPGAPPPSTPGAPPPFVPVSIEAETATLAGSAVRATCATCSDGTKVDFIGADSGTVTVGGINAPSAGTHQMTVIYELGGTKARTFYISVNGGTAIQTTLTPATTDWNKQQTTTVSIALSAGSNSIKFYNPTSGHTPDLDKINIQ